MILNEIIYYKIMNIDKLLSQINSSLNYVLKQNLTPFVDEINNNNKQHELIKSILFQMPEYINLEKKYNELQKKYDILKKELKNREIGLEISEKEILDNYEEDDANDIDLSHWRSGFGNMSNNQAEDSDEVDNLNTKKILVSNKWNKAEHERVIRGEREEQQEELSEEEQAEQSEEEQSEEEQSEEEQSEEEEAEQSEEEEAEQSEEEQAEQSEEEEAEQSEEEEAEQSEEEEAEQLEEEEAEQLEEEEAEQLEEEEEYFMIELEVNGKTVEFYTNDEENGYFYEVLENDEMGEIVGKITDGEPEFN
jgi:hypothetical protein